MVYETFQESITTKLKDRLGDGYMLLLQKVPKNNGLILDGLSIRPKDQAAAPIIYLNQYYERFKKGTSMEDLVDEIAEIYRMNSGIIHVDFSILNDFEKLKDKVFFRLINTNANKALLTDLPSIPYLDLSIVFYLQLGQNEFGQMTALIHNRHMDTWKVTTDQLYMLALANMPRMLPADLKSMLQVIKDIAKARLEDDYKEGMIEKLLPAHEGAPLYVLSNSSGINGAGAMLYPGELKNFANLMDRDLVILPSSIHEVLLLPYDTTVDYTELHNLVVFVNENEVPPEDVLSDHIYFYSRVADEVIIIQENASAYVS